MFSQNHKFTKIRAVAPLIAVGCLIPIGSAQTTPTFGGGNPSDPGVRRGAAAAGTPIAGLDKNLLAAFQSGSDDFQEVENVATDGLGPRFNSDSCFSCHSQPAIGGTSPDVNPQIKFAKGPNSLPSFITSNGPAREARFIKKRDGTPDGGVHALFTIMGLPGVPSNCRLDQEDFSNMSNISLRIPTPTFGLGLIEAITDTALQQNLDSNGSRFGIGGRLNRNGNDGTVTRFGWKAQNKSLLIFSGEAYNVEMGISNFLFNTERDETRGCSPVAPPNGVFHLAEANSGVFDDIVNFANFMRFLAPPGRGPIDATVTKGSSLFDSVGCAGCHTAKLQTGPSAFSQLANQTIFPYSDFALHHMGPKLADQISQGLAGGDEFRTAPLWGLGQRIFFLHDGRTKDLEQAIREHSSDSDRNSPFPDSEANAVIRNYFNLSNSDQQALLNFLRSL